MQIDFSAAFHGVNDREIHYEHCSVGIGGFVLSILTVFSNRSQHGMVDCCRCELVNVASGVSQNSVLGQLLYLLHNSEIFPILDKLIGFADDYFDSYCMPNRDLGMVREWWEVWEIKLNASKNTTIIVTRSRTMHPQYPYSLLVELC